MFGLCDTPDRVGAHIFLALGGGTCPCCAFYRGMAVGGVVAALVAGAFVIGWLQGFLST